MNTDKLKELIQKKKNMIIILIGVVGVLLLFVSELPQKNTTEKTGKQTLTNTYSQMQEEIENKLTKMLSSVDGAGNVAVMLTLDSGGEQLYAQDIKYRQSMDEKGTELSTEENYIIIDSSSGDGGLLLKNISPEIRGVAVVCEGGGNAEIKREITETVCAALGIGREKIYVTKMKSTK